MSIATALVAVQLASGVAMFARDWSLVVLVASNGIYVFDKIKNTVCFLAEPMIYGNASNEKKMADLFLSCWSTSNLALTCGRESEADVLDVDTIDNLLAEVPTAPKVSFVNWVVSIVRRG
jgi:hypothetical protein